MTHPPGIYSFVACSIILSPAIEVTTKIETVDGQVISISQSTEAESKLSATYNLLYINLKPLGKRKSMLHQIRLQKSGY